MEVCLDVDPVRTLLVLGPQVTAQCLSESSSSPHGQQQHAHHHHHHLHQQQQHHHHHHPSFLEYRRIVEHGMKRSLELEDLASGEAIRRKEKLLLNAYELEPSFAANKVFETLKEHNEFDSWMKEVSVSSKDYQFDSSSSPTLQYILSLRREGVRLIYTHYDDLLARALGLPVVLMDDDENVRKWSQGFPALLHVHGVFSRPQSVKMDCLCYKTQVGEGKTADIVREQFQSRAVIFLGFDEPFIDPLLSKMLATFAGPAVMPSSFPLLLTCLSGSPPVSNGCVTLKTQKLDLGLILKVSSTSLGVAPMNDASHPVSIRLISADSQTTQEVIDVLSRFPNIMARVSEDGLILNLQMSRPSLHRMWTEVFMYSLLSPSCGVGVVHLEGSFLVRAQEKPSRNNTSVAFTPSSGQLKVIPPISSSLWKPPVSTATALSLIGSPQQQQQFIKQHEKVRRIQSENDFREQHHETKRRNNGLLTHQQSAPSFPYIASQGSLIRPPLFAVPTIPPMLLNMEQKKVEQNTSTAAIETVEQVEDSRQQLKKTEPEREEKGFEKKKFKFIQEARQWSKTLEEKLGSSTNTKSSEHQSISSSVPSSSNLESIRGTAVSNNSNVVFTPPSTSPQVTSYSSPQLNSSHSPILTSQKQPPTFLMSSPQSGGMYTILPHSPSIGTAGGGMLPNQVPLLAAAAMQQSLQQQLNQSPKDGNRGVIPVNTPTLNPEKFVYMLQDGTILATPIIQERQLSSTGVVGSDQQQPLLKDDHASLNRSPKRIGSPNSDTDILTYYPRKRRRSSSLPVNNPKSPSSSSDSSQSTTPPPPTTFQPTMSPSDIKLEQPHSHQLLTFPQITSPSTGHLFFPHTIATATDHCSIMKMEGDITSREDKGIPTDSEAAQPPSPPDQLHPVPVGRGPIQLWQFLLDLLISPDKAHMIQWTGNGYEFRIIQPEEIAKLWGARKNKPRMNYDKLSRGLRYYYSKGIMDKVPGKKLTFKYTCNIQQYMTQRSAGTSDPSQIAVSNNSL